MDVLQEDTLYWNTLVENMECFMNAVQGELIKSPLSLTCI